MGWQDDAIVEPAAAPAAKQPWENDAIVAPAAGPRVASGIGEAWQAGYQGSIPGLVDRGKLPDIVLDPHHSTWYEKLTASASHMVNELPEMMAGAAAGAPAGAAVGGAGGALFAGVGALPGAAVGGIVGGGAGAFAIPTAIRESLVQYYEQRDGVSSADFLTRAGIVIKATGKDALIGAATAGAGAGVGKLVAPVLGGAVMAGKIGARTARVGTDVATVGAEVGTLTVAPAALEGRLPEPEDFMNAAILVGGLKGAHATASRLRQVYAETGKRPEQVLADAQKDPTIAAELSAPPAVEPQIFAVLGTPGEVGAQRVMPDGTKQRLLRKEDGTMFWGEHREVIDYTGAKSVEGADALAEPAVFKTAKEAREAGAAVEGGAEAKTPTARDAKAELAAATTALPEGLALKETPSGFEVTNAEGQRVGYLNDNLKRGQAAMIDESANVDMVLVNEDARGQGVGRALYAAFYEKHDGRILPSGKTEQAAWDTWKRNYPEKVDVFVESEAARIRDGASSELVLGNIKDPEIRTRVAEAAQGPAPEEAAKPTGELSLAPMEAAHSPWFAGSKVVTPEGQPQVVFHGTTADIKTFSSEHLGATTAADSAKGGFFFTDHPGVASTYATDFMGRSTHEAKRALDAAKAAGDEVKTAEAQAALDAALASEKKTRVAEGANVVPVYLSLKNPLEIDFAGKPYAEGAITDAIAKAKAEGRDGVIFRSINDDPNERRPSTVYVAFDAKQIKSAIAERSAVSEVPRAYQAEALQNRANDIVPGVKTEEVRTEPFGPVTQVAGEPAKPTEINYNFMHTTEDAKAALARLSKVYEAEIQTQRRGTVTWEQTQVEAGQHIADLLGSTTPFEPRAPGQAAGAAELLARKQMLQGAAEDMAVKARKFLETPEELRTALQTAEYLASIERAAMIQAEFLGARAETGRALNILKETKLTAERAEHIQELISRYGKDPAQLAEMMAALDNPAAALKFAKEAQKSTTWEKLIEAWKAGLVSGPITQVANVAGNTTFMAVRPVVDTVAASIGLVTRAPDRVRMVEPLARVVGNLQGVSDGLRMARVAFMEDAPAGKADQFKQAIPGTAGYVIRTPFRALSAMDAIFRSMAERGEANAIGAREAAREGYNPATREFRERMAEIAQNLTPEQTKLVEDFATRATFQAKPGAKAMWWFKALNETPGSELIVPFKTTPLNVFKEAARISPLAPLVGEWRAALAKGGPEAQRAWAELAVGTGIAALTTAWAVSGNISGNGDPDPNKRRAMMASGWQPYSIKVGDTWYSYQRMAPLGLVIGAAADAADIYQHATPEENGKIAKMVAAMFANAVTNATFLQGVTQLNNVINDPQRYGPAWVRSLAASPIPAVVSQTAQLMDPYQREIGSVTEAIKGRIPGLREGLTPTRDIFGEPVPNPNTIAAVKVSTESDDPVRKEAARLGVGSPEAPKTIELPSGGTKLGKVQLTQEQRDVFGSEAGHMAHDIMTPMVNSPGWQYMPDFAKQKAFKMVFEKANEFGKYKALSSEQRQTEIQRITTDISKKLTQ
jgi:GNAT superfamily N-acetyltransferase